MKKNNKKSFDFSKFRQRYVALKILYFGWDYDGLAEQSSNDNTVEFHLFQALTKTCLVESRAKCNYNRCGRTDKGVSSYGQVVNLSLRSNLWDEEDPENLGLFTPENYCSDSSKSEQKSELNYVEILNRVLPDYIKVIAWAPVTKDFSSRFSCQSRSYSYIFPLGDLCIQSMQQAISYLVGEHDFRNLCSLDLKHGVINHKRTILSTHIKPLRYTDCDDSKTVISPFAFYEIVIVGHAFLYHQIRCIMTIIFLVGTGSEKPEVVRDLLDIEKCPSKPNYNMASPLPLSLFDCEYNSQDLPLGWKYDKLALQHLSQQLKKLWHQYKTKTLMIERALFGIDAIVNECDLSQPVAKKTKTTSSCRWKEFGLECDNMSETKYTNLLKRPRDETLESKLEALKRKK